MTHSLPSEFLRAISREAMAELPIGRYEGDICLVRTPRELEVAREDLMQEAFVGFDTETRPSFRVGESHPPCLVQAATARRVYLFRLLQESDFHVPAELVEKADTLKVGIGLVDDIRALQKLRPLEYRGMLDLGSVARSHGFTQTGVRNLAGLFLKMRITKGTKTSNWAAPSLTTAQIVYAATDAWICRELFIRFQGFGMIQS